jgi:hypothetical protein
MKIEFINGTLVGKAESIEDVEVLMGMILDNGIKKEDSIPLVKQDGRRKTCDICGKKFKKGKMALITHKVRAHGEKKWNTFRALPGGQLAHCNDCEREFNSLKGLRNHQTRMHDLITHII